MNRTRFIALSVGFALVAAGCDDEFLTTLPPDQVSGAVFWQQQKDAELAVNALYGTNDAQLISVRMDAASDNAWAQKSFDAWYDVGQGAALPTNAVFNNVWNTAYTGIRRANEILENIDRIPTINPATLRDRLKGEATFFRAYHYNNLVNLYGDVPLVLGPISIEEGRAATRTPRAQVVDQILKDLDYAASVLPNTYNAANRGRVTRGAALGYKARAALWAGRWQDAANAAQAVINMNQYSLHPNYADLTRYAADNSAELIFTDMREKGVRAHGAFGWFGQRSLQGVSDITPLRELVDAYQMRDGLPITQSPLYDAANPYANKDPRMSATLLVPGDSYCGTLFNSRPGSGTVDEVRADFNSTSTGFQFTRYVDCADRNDRGNSGIDFILMRYAEVLLTYAEAKIELNQVDQSVFNAINAVRTRAGMPAVNSGNQASLRDLVRYERRVEFVLEGLRIHDIRRWGIAEQVMAGQKYGINYVDAGQVRRWIADNRRFNPQRDHLWPIPQRERDLNPNLAQNPNYGG
jgi:starch-binding outer membrane protein, SusD/RagB family